nr:hypothetical protein [Tanacetum cinerariifolium]
MAKNRMFKFFAVAQAMKESCFNSSMEDRARLWHYRYGHLSFNGLNLLKQTEMVRGLPHLGTSSSVCEDCLVGKQQRNPFPQESTWRASQILDLVHADIFTKSEAFVVFKQYKSRVEKERDVSIKGLRRSGGRGFTSLEFTNVCNDNGKKLPKKLWPEAVNWTVHIHNRIPTLAVSNICPEEAWSGFKPSMAYFKLFGSIAYMYSQDCKRIKLDDKSKKCVFIGVSEESKAHRLYDPVSKKIITLPDATTLSGSSNGSDCKRIKLDDKSKKCVFIGVSEESKAHRLYDPVSKKIIVSRDIVFDEEASWDWEKSRKESVLMNLDWGENETLLDATTLSGSSNGSIDAIVKTSN